MERTYLFRLLCVLRFIAVTITVYIPSSQFDTPKEWSYEISTWENEVNVTIPSGGWDGHWTQYPQFVDGFIRLASAERTDRQNPGANYVGRLPRQMSPRLYQQVFDYATVEFRGTTPPSLNGKRFDKFFLNNGDVTCVVIRSVSESTNEITEAICSPTNQSTNSGQTCRDWSMRSVNQRVTVNSVVLIGFGNARCSDVVRHAMMYTKILLINSNISLDGCYNHEYITLLNSRLTFVRAYGVFFRCRVGLIHLTDSSELHLDVAPLRMLQIWKVLRLSDNSRAVIRQRDGGRRDYFKIEAVVRDNASSCSVDNIDVASTKVSNFDYVQETYEYLLYFWTRVTSTSYIYWVRFEYPASYPWFYKREPCPGNTTLTEFVSFDEPRCIYSPSRFLDYRDY